MPNNYIDRYLTKLAIAVIKNSINESRQDGKVSPKVAVLLVASKGDMSFEQTFSTYVKGDVIIDFAGNYNIIITESSVDSDMSIYTE